MKKKKFLSKVKYFIQYNLFFNKSEVINDNAFSYQDRDVKKIFEDMKNPLARDDFNQEREIINKYCKNFDVDPYIIVLLFESFLKDTDYKASKNIVSDKLGFNNMPGMEVKISTYIRTLKRYYDTKSSTKVKVMDENNLEIKNDATRALYNIVPYVGYKDFYVYDRESDPNGNITNVDRNLEKEAPFGVFYMWLKGNEYNMEDILE